ncbi:phospholipid carrier-dependent glycosyltransferase [Peristeroidobacter soli]|uniref:phospholipid carrier-dependent glycosyltransferase n=1 Tax=Peristeroidobacter soli TaxID=2497877 RepID=UPI00101B8079|nr:phospholipid carrier-dependent glycosyltransferase [Peristeroidobacter soli]
MSTLPRPAAALPAAARVRLQTLLVVASIAALTIVWFALALGRPLANPDEGRYAEIPREMVLRGDWVTPHLNGVAYLEKPPLQYWATAAVYKFFGEGEWTARVCTMLAAWLNVLLMFLLGRRLWGIRAGVLAAAFLGSTVLHFLMGQILTLDMAFTFLLTAMLCAFCMTQVTRGVAPRESGHWMRAAWLLLALAVLTKGIAALVIAGAVLTLYVLWQRDWAVLRTLRPVSGVVIFAVVAGPWFYLVARANPEFLHFFFIEQHFQRYLTDAAQRIEPWWYFIAILAAGTLPWLPQMAGALCNGWRTSHRPGQFDARRLLWVWCVFVLVFFSLSNSKLAPYVLPILPPLALLTASREECIDSRSLRISIGALVLFAIALIVYCAGANLFTKDPVTLEAIEQARFAVAAFAMIAFATAVLGWREVRAGHATRAIPGIAAAWFIGFALLFATAAQHESLRSGKSLAAQIPADLAAHAPIFSVQTYDQTLPFYLRRTMFMVDSRGELDFGLRQTPGAAIPEMARFEQTWRELNEGIAIMSHKSYAQLQARGLPMRVLGSDKRRVAVSRR